MQATDGAMARTTEDGDDSTASASAREGSQGTVGGLRAVLFDFDGTVVDSYDLILESFHHAVRAVLGVDYADEVLMRKVGQPLVVQMEDFIRNRALRDELCRVYREHNARIHDDRIRLFPGVRETLSALRTAGLATGIVTSKRHGPALRGLRVFGLEGLFDVLVGSDDCPRHKPDPAPVEQAARMLGLAPASCAYVGDSPYDLQAGCGAGCLTVAATWGMFSESVLRAEGPDLAMGSFEELRALVR